jgi:hypothetical protein
MTDGNPFGGTEGREPLIIDCVDALAHGLSVVLQPVRQDLRQAEVAHKHEMSALLAHKLSGAYPACAHKGQSTRPCFFRVNCTSITLQQSFTQPEKYRVAVSVLQLQYYP